MSAHQRREDEGSEPGEGAGQERHVERHDQAPAGLMTRGVPVFCKASVLAPRRPLGGGPLTETYARMRFTVLMVTVDPVSRRRTSFPFDTARWHSVEGAMPMRLAAARIS